MPGNTAYCLSKGGMRMLTRTAGVELAPHGILVVGVGPGAVETPINLRHGRPGAAGEARRRHPARPHGAAGGDRQRRRIPGRRRRQLHRPPRPSSPTAASCRPASVCSAMDRALRRHHHRQRGRGRDAGASAGAVGQAHPAPRARRLAAARGATTGTWRRCSPTIATCRRRPGYDGGGQATSSRRCTTTSAAPRKMFGAALFRLRREDFGELHHYDGLSPAWPIGYDELEPYYTPGRAALPGARRARRRPDRAAGQRALSLARRCRTSRASSASATT